MASRGTQALQIGLGAFSLALGAAPLVAPHGVARAAGLSTRPLTRGVLRAVGLRELAVGTGLITTQRPAWLWARVAQDVMDVPLASVTTARKAGEDRARMVRVTAFLLAVTVVDVAAAIRATAAAARDEERRRRMVFRAAVTIRRDEAEVVARLPEADPPLSTEATVIFAPAPGGRGTEVRAVLDKGSGGPVGKVVGAVTGTDPGRELSDAMRRFKQVLETGEVIRSEGSPEGVNAPRTRKQRAAEPIGAES